MSDQGDSTETLLKKVIGPDKFAQLKELFDKRFILLAETDVERANRTEYVECFMREIINDYPIYKWLVEQGAHDRKPTDQRERLEKAIANFKESLELIDGFITNPLPQQSFENTPESELVSVMGREGYIVRQHLTNIIKQCAFTIKTIPAGSGPPEADATQFFQELATAFALYICGDGPISKADIRGKKSMKGFFKNVANVLNLKPTDDTSRAVDAAVEAVNKRYRC